MLTSACMVRRRLTEIPPGIDQPLHRCGSVGGPRVQEVLGQAQVVLLAPLDGDGDVADLELDGLRGGGIVV